jgi:hypothetical protein
MTWQLPLNGCWEPIRAGEDWWVHLKNLFPCTWSESKNWGKACFVKVIWDEQWGFLCWHELYQHFPVPHLRDLGVSTYSNVENHVSGKQSHMLPVSEACQGSLSKENSLNYFTLLHLWSWDGWVLTRLLGSPTNVFYMLLLLSIFILFTGNYDFLPCTSIANLYVLFSGQKSNI